MDQSMDGSQNSPLSDSEAWLEGVFDTACELFPDAVELAVNTQDEELFLKVLDKANTILVERTVSSLIDKGLVEMAGMNEEGDFTFQLTEEGKIAAEGIPKS